MELIPRIYRALPGSYHLSRLFLTLQFMTIMPHLFGSHLSAFAYNTTLVQYGREAEDRGSMCWQYTHMNGGLIFSHAGLDGYTNDADCKVTVTTEPGKRIYLRFESFDIADSLNCYKDEVIVYDGRTYASLKLSGAPYGLCGTSVDLRYREMRSTGNEITVRFITDSIWTNNKGFVIVFASFDPDPPEETQNKDDDSGCFPCEDDSICIDRKLACDQLWNCPDGSDENYQLCYADPTEEPESKSSGWLTWMGTFFAIIVAAIIVIFVILSLIACCCCRDKAFDAVRADPNYMGRMAPGCNSSEEVDSSQSSCTSHEDSVELGMRAYSSSCTGSSSATTDSTPPVGSTKLLYGYSHHGPSSSRHHPSTQRHLSNMYSFNPGPSDYTKNQNYNDFKLRDLYANLAERTVAYQAGQVDLPPEVECR